MAAVALMKIGLPFRDFLYLQTPLQPVLLAPLAWLTDSHLFVLLRLTNALMGGAVLYIVYSAVRRHGGAAHHAVAAALLMASTGVFIFAASLARNDALPMLLYTAGIYALLKPAHRPAEYGGELRFFLAGLAIGAAASAKINYGVPAAAAGLWALWCWPKLGARNVIAFALGGAAGLLPCLIFWLIAPDATLFGIFEYSLKAPQQWRELNGHEHVLGWQNTAYSFLRYIGEGPALFALLILFCLWMAQRGRPTQPELSASLALLDLLILAGLVVAFLPQPTYRQYLGPVLPPLFIRLGLSFGMLAPYRQISNTLLAIGAAIGILVSQRSAARNLLQGQSPPVLAMRDAHWIGGVLRQEHIAGPLAGIRPERFVDSGWSLDRRFVTGPFIFRTVHLLSRKEERVFSVVAHRNLAAAFHEAPPGAIVVGNERRGARIVPLGLDYPLEQWAVRNHYLPIAAPSGAVTLYIRPRYDTTRSRLTRTRSFERRQNAS